MNLPNYSGGSIVNLMSSIGSACGARLPYGPLKALPPSAIKNKSIVLIVFDGLGHEFLKAHGGKLWKMCSGRMTSVFPSTTAAAITTFHTGLAPAEHGLTGWFMHVKELGLVAVPLSAKARAGGDIKTDTLLTEKPFFDRLKVRSFVVMPADICHTAYNQVYSGRAERLCYRSLGGFVRQIRTAVMQPGAKYVYAYWPLIDNYCHHFGTRSRKTLSHLREIERMLPQLSGLDDTTVIITADHGLMDEHHPIDIEDHPDFKGTLSLPLCGDSRARYCYVHPSGERAFKDYVKRKFSRACKLYRSDEILPWLGTNRQHPMLRERIGDYVLVMNDGYSMRDCIEGEHHHKHKASHGGLSKEEMYVPLIVVLG
jgi:predicted AlkP superfamily pyrophosphatase or phosphodiesterase